MRSFILVLATVCVLMLASQSKVFAQEETPSCPPILKELYYPTSLQLTFTTIEMIKYGKNIAPADIPYQFGETSTGPPQNQLTIIWATQNTTATWQLDFFINYTAPTPQYVLYSTTELDSTGIPKMQQDSCYTSGAQVWIHFQITTKEAPRPPTLAETWGFLLQPNNLLVNALSANRDSVQALEAWVVMTFAMSAINTIVIGFDIGIRILRRLWGAQ